MARISDPQESDPTIVQHPSNGKTILLAEDDPFISRMYEVKLTSAGFKVETTNNGRDAYERIKQDQPDLIMLDINMPELTGFEVIKALKADHADGLIDKIIMLTNSANPDDRKQADDLGIDYVVKAEMTPRDVLNRINLKLGLPAT